MTNDELGALPLMLGVTRPIRHSSFEKFVIKFVQHL